MFRSADTVMNPNRLGAMHQTRLSFARVLLRRMVQDKWHVTNVLWDLSNRGFGTAIYQLKTPNHLYNFVVFSNHIPDEARNDRVVAEQWDVSFALVKGKVSKSLLNKLQKNVPLQEMGRNSNKVLVLSRANKSVRVFNHVLESLSRGKQPSTDILLTVGYILRTTAVYGNGKFGIADFEILKEESDFNLSFVAQMCAVYMLRNFSIDWLHFLAKKKGGSKATTLDRNMQRYLGVGNATGLGMAPFLVKHPRIVENWLSQREKALEKVLQRKATLEKSKKMIELLLRAQKHLQQIITIDKDQDMLNKKCVRHLQKVIKNVKTVVDQKKTWKNLIKYNENLEYEAQEATVSCLLELHPELVDDYCASMNTDEDLHLQSGLTIADIINLLKKNFRWAIETDFSNPNNTYWFWYSSEEKEEPRLGVRNKEPGQDKEHPIDIGRQVHNLYQILMKAKPSQSLSEFLLQNPSCYYILRRVWTMGNSNLGEIQMNVLSRKMLPIHLLRCKLSFLGATKFDPRSDRWVRVTFFQGSPLMDEINDGEWLFPILPSMQST